MRIFLTGASGMVGRNILEHPKSVGHTWLTPGHADLDLTDRWAVQTFYEQEQPEFVIHVAGRVGGINANIKNPVGFLVDNIDMGRNILMAAHETGVKRLLNLGSSCMYPRYAVNPLKEDSILTAELEPTNEGYALAKIMVERLCRYISQQDSVFDYKTLVPCNLYGRWDKFEPHHSHLIAAVIDKIHKAKAEGLDTVEIWGDGQARREFMYCADLADTIFDAVERFETLPELMNVGIGSDDSINEIYQAVADVIGYKGAFTHDLTKPVGMQQKLVDVSRQDTWGHSPRTSLVDGVTQIYEFYLNKICA